VTIAATLLTTALAACGGDGDKRSADKPRTPAPDAVAMVGSAKITVREFDHWMRLASRSRRLAKVPPRGSPRWDGLRPEVMDLLIQNQWVSQEARRQEIGISNAELQLEFQRQKDESFPDERAYRRFIETSGQTEDDILFRLRVELLSNRFRERVVKGKDGRKARQAALDRFVKDFYDRWHPKTRCAPLYRHRDCDRFDLPDPRP